MMIGSDSEFRLRYVPTAELDVVSERSGNPFSHIRLQNGVSQSRVRRTLPPLELSSKTPVRTFLMVRTFLIDNEERARVSCARSLP